VVSVSTGVSSTETEHVSRKLAQRPMSSPPRTSTDVTERTQDFHAPNPTSGAVSRSWSGPRLGGDHVTPSTLSPHGNLPHRTPGDDTGLPRTPHSNRHRRGLCNRR
jgi:hypothetical protein